MVRFARRRLRGRAARVYAGDMRHFSAPEPCDVAFCLNGTFRHLASDGAALAHLRAVASSLAPGGVYLLGLDLADYRRLEPDEETWEAEGPRGRIRQVQVSLGAEPRRRRERILQFVSYRGRLDRREYDLRTYDARQWRALLARSPFELIATYDPWLARARLDASTRAATFVLRGLANQRRVGYS